MTRPHSPPETAIAEAIKAARQSPCKKSKRGATLFNPHTGLVTIGMWNARPDNKCDERCQAKTNDNLLALADSLDLPSTPSRCSMLCEHAEAQAIRVAGYISERSQFIADGDTAFVLTQLELVHAKVNDHGELVPSGGPSCWQCAKVIANIGLVGVWLYEARPAPSGSGGLATWHFYPTQQFYDLTMKECRLA